MVSSGFMAGRHPFFHEKSVTSPNLLFDLLKTWGLTSRSRRFNSHLKFEVATEGLGKFTEGFKSLPERKEIKMQI